MTIYLDDKTEAELNAAVRASGMSKSKWIAQLIREKACEEWPDAVKKLAGAWSDLPTEDVLRKTCG